MGGKKRQKHCGHIKPHPSHTWDYEPKNAKHPHVEKVWCKGIGRHHVHVWDANSYPIMQRPDGKVSALGEPGVPWTGPFQCQCGASAWLTNGYKKRDLPAQEERFPIGEPMDRILALRAKLARGKEFWTDEDQAELEAIGEALIEALKPISEALVKLGEQMSEYMRSFFDKLDPILLAQIAEHAKSIGERPDAVETIDLVDGNGAVLSTHILTPEPVSAVTGPTAIVEDALQARYTG